MGKRKCWERERNGERTEAAEGKDLPGMREELHFPRLLGIQDHIRKKMDYFVLQLELHEEGREGQRTAEEAEESHGGVMP